MKQSCKTCKFAEMQRTPSGRVSQRAGQCTYQVVMPPLPDSITRAWGFKTEFSKKYIWPNDGEKCPVYEKEIDE